MCAASEPWFRQSNVATIAGLTALTYFVILGEAGQHDLNPILRILNAAAAGTLILIYVTTAPRRADRVDRAVLLGLLLFAAAAVLAQFPRQAFDALLAALLFTATLFVARTLLTREAARVAFVACLIVLSSLLTFLTAARWLLPALEWWSLTDWSVIPPLDLNLPAVPWGHRHDLTLLIVMLYPSWWVGRVGPLRAAIATVVGILTLLIVVVDGSRTVWLAMAAASAVLVAPVALRHLPRDVRRLSAIVLAVAATIVVAAVSGIFGTVLERILTSGTLEARGAMWGPLTQAWLAKPVAGYGPGSFAWVLQTTNYFDTNVLAPRHPDSVIFQLLPEAGLLGVAVLIIVVLTILPALIRGRSRAALWALIAFALAGLGANPTDFGFLVAVAIGWVAFAIPREAESQIAAPAGRHFVTLASLACLALIAAAWTATAVANVSYIAAQSGVANGRVDEAIPRLEVARALDPGMALYARQLGTAWLLMDDPSAAIPYLEEAIRLNPSDDLGWRSLAMAHAASGDDGSAWADLGQALTTQRSDPTNLLLAARSHIETGNDNEALATLGEVVQAWPEIVAAPGWVELLPEGLTTLDVINVALDRWSRDLPSPEPRFLQALLLSVMAGRTDLSEESNEEAVSPSLGAMYVAVMSCRTDAPSLLEQAPDSDRRTSVYWSLVARQSAQDGQVNDRALRLIDIMTDDPLQSRPTDETMNPLEENGAGGYSADYWGYRRTRMVWPDYEELPSPWVGATRLIVEPIEAWAAAGLGSMVQACR